MSILLINSSAYLQPIADESVQCIITSPPYWKLRDYDVPGQIGQEHTPDEFVANLVAVFAEMKRILKPDGTLWINIADSHASKTKGTGGRTEKQDSVRGRHYGATVCDPGVPDKNLIGIPWKLAFALQADGWIVKSEVIWNKTNVMPEPKRDRLTMSHEKIFLLSKNPRCYFDADAIKEPAKESSKARYKRAIGNNHKYANDAPVLNSDQALFSSFESINDEDWRLKRDVWAIPTSGGLAGSHYAAYPPKLIEPCVLAGSQPGDIIFDPFVGSGTTVQVARALDRHGIGADLKYQYLRDDARERLLLNALDDWRNGKPGETVLDDLPLFKNGW